MVAPPASYSTSATTRTSECANNNNNNEPPRRISFTGYQKSIVYLLRNKDFTRMAIVPKLGMRSSNRRFQYLAHYSIMSGSSDDINIVRVPHYVTDGTVNIRTKWPEHEQGVFVEQQITLGTVRCRTEKRFTFAIELLEI